MVIRSEEAKQAVPSSKQLTILLISGFSLMRTALRQLLVSMGGVLAVREASAADEAVALATREPPTIALIDADRIGDDTLALVRRILAAAPTAYPIVLSDDDVSDFVVPAVSAGVRGFIPRDVSPAELERAVRFVAAGRLVVGGWFHPQRFEEFARLATKHPAFPAALSHRESAVIEAMASGETDGQIAAHLGVSVPTVKTHVRSILRKTSARNRAQAIAAAFRNGVLS